MSYEGVRSKSRTYHWHVLDNQDVIRMQPDIYAPNHQHALRRMIEVAASLAYVGFEPANKTGEAHIHWASDPGDKGHLKVTVSDVTEVPVPVTKDRS